MEIDNEYENPETLSEEDGLGDAKPKHPTMDDLPHVITNKELKVIKESVLFMTDTMKSFTKMFCDDDGVIIDFTDKAGQKRNREFMVGVQTKVNKTLERIENDMDEHYSAQFVPEDKELLVQLIKKFRNIWYWVFGSCFIGALFFILGMLITFKAEDKSDQLKVWYEKQADMAAFGYYVKESVPRNYRIWKSESLEYKDSLKKAHGLD